MLINDAHADYQHMAREISALVFELHTRGVDVTAESLKAEELLAACNYMGLRELQNELVDKLDREVGW